MHKKLIKKVIISIGILAGTALAFYGIKIGVSAISTLNAPTNSIKLFNEADGIICQGIAEGEDVNVNSKLPGKIATVIAKEGQQVKKGDIVATLENNELLAKKQQLISQRDAAKAAYDAQVAQSGAARAAVEAAKSKLSEAQAGTLAAEWQVTGAEAIEDKADNGARQQELAQAQAQYDLWCKTYDRVKNLYIKGAVPAQKVDEVEAQLKVAEQTLSMAKEGARKEDKAGAKANVQMASAGKLARDSQVQQAQAGISAANAQLQQSLAGETAKLAQQSQAQSGIDEVDSYLKDTTITSPIDGIVTTVNAKSGELVTTGMPIAIIGNFNNIKFDFKVKETNITGITEGQTIQVKLPSINGETFTGKVISVNRMPDYATKRSTGENGNIDIVAYSVKVLVENPNDKIRSGMTAFAQFKK